MSCSPIGKSASVEPSRVALLLDRELRLDPRPDDREVMPDVSESGLDPGALRVIDEPISVGVTLSGEDATAIVGEGKVCVTGMGDN